MTDVGVQPEPTIETQYSLRSVVVVVFAAGAAISAALDPGAATGIGWWDTILSAGLAAIVTVAGQRARPWIVIAVLAALAPFGPTVALPFAGVAIMALIATQLLAGDQLLRLATTGAAALATVLGLGLSTTLPPLNRFGVPSLLAGVAFLLITGSAVVSLPRPSRRTTLQWAGGALFFAGLTLAPIAVLGPSIRSSALAGASSAAKGIAAGRTGDTELAVAELRSAEQSLALTHQRIESRWLTAARLTPVVSQQLHASAVLAEQGTLLAAAGASAASAAQPAAIRDLDGNFDLTAAEQAAPPLAELDQVLTNAQGALATAGSPWLVAPVERQRLAAVDRVAEAIPASRAASGAMSSLPFLLGADAPRRYLVLLATPAETRELGGFVGNYLELIVDDGTLSIGEADRIAELYQRGPAVLPDADTYPLRFLANDPERWPQNWTSLPDFPLVAKAIRGMYPSIGGGELDGVLYVDPIGMAAMLEFTGPIEVPEIGRTLDHTSIADYLLYEQYGGFGHEEKSERAEVLDLISHRTFEALASADLSDPQHIASVIEPVAKGGHLSMTVFDPAADAFIDSVGLRGAFPEPDGSDFLSVVQANTSPNKLDTFLERTIRYSVDVDRATVNATVEVDLFNSANESLPAYVFGNEGSADGLPFGTNLVHLSIYTSHQLTGAWVDGKPTPIESHVELGYNRYLVVAPVGLGETVPVRFELTGTTEQVDGPYQVTLANQALATTDAVQVNVRRSAMESAEIQHLDLQSDTRLSFFTD